jgi:hypothetical protein
MIYIRNNILIPYILTISLIYASKYSLRKLGEVLFSNGENLGGNDGIRIFLIP